MNFTILTIEKFFRGLNPEVLYTLWSLRNPICHVLEVFNLTMKSLFYFCLLLFTFANWLGNLQNTVSNPLIPEAYGVSVEEKTEFLTNYFIEFNWQLTRYIFRWYQLQLSTHSVPTANFVFICTIKFLIFKTKAWFLCNMTSCST